MHYSLNFFLFSYSRININMLVFHKPDDNKEYFRRISKKADEKLSVNSIYPAAPFENSDEPSCNYINSEVSSGNSDEESYCY